MIDLKAAHYTKPYEKPIVGVSNYPSEDVDNFLSATSGSTAITEADPPSRLDSAIAIVQHGRFLEILGNDPGLFVLEVIESRLFPSTKTANPLFPPLFVLHGENDTAVPVDGTRKLVDLLRKGDADDKVHVVIQPGDHGFDFTATTKDSWLREGLDFVSRHWLSNKCRF